MCVCVVRADVICLSPLSFSLALSLYFFVLVKVPAAYINQVSCLFGVVGFPPL